MSNEITLGFTLSVTNGTFAGNWPNVYAQFTQSSQGAAGGTVATSTTYANLSYGNIAGASIGYLVLRNLDSTDNIDWGLETAGPAFTAVGKLKPGELAFLRLKPSVTFAVKAEANTPILQYWLLKD